MHAYRDQYAQLFHDGRNVVLIGISMDPIDALASWAKDDEFPFLFASDSGGVLGKTYGAHNPRFGLDNRNLFVVGPDGKIAYVMAPFKEIDPQSYKDLAGAIDRITPKPAEGEEPGYVPTTCSSAVATSCSAPAPVYLTFPALSSTTMYDVVGAWYARTAAPFASYHTGNGSGWAARWRLIEAAVSFTPTPIAMNCTVAP